MTPPPATHPSPTRARIWTGALFYFIAGVAVVTVIVGVVYQIQLSTRLTQIAEQNQQIGRANRANGNLLVECTTPPSERTPPKTVAVGEESKDCFTRSQAATGQAVQDIGVISIAAAACGAANPGDVSETEACVKRTLADKAKVRR